MDFFKFGLRNILGLTVPGAIIIIIFYYVLLVLSSIFNVSSDYYNDLKDKQTLIILISLVFSYMIGSIIRLIAADYIDGKSQEKYIKKNITELQEIVKEMESITADKTDDESQIMKNIKDLQIIEKKMESITKTINNKSQKEKIKNNITELQKIFEKKEPITAKEIDNKSQIMKNIENLQDIVKETKSIADIIKIKKIIEDLQRIAEKMKPKGDSPKIVKSKLDKILDKAYSNFLDGDDKWFSSFPKFDEWIYYIDIFPYPLWEFRRFELNLPKGYLTFFESYRKEMSRKESKGFFNYCKTVILASKISEELKNEVSNAEAFSRFLAGTYFALISSIFLLALCILLQFIFTPSIEFKHVYLIFNLVIPSVLFLVFIISMHFIAKFYRKIRLKEVDIVYEAFYIACDYHNKFPNIVSDKDSKEMKSIHQN